MLTLEDYVTENAEALSAFATSRTNPIHLPGRDETLDFSDLLRQPVSGQKHVITAAVKALKRMKSIELVCATGTGKTIVSIATIHKHAERSLVEYKGKLYVRGLRRNYRTLVFCPGQLVKKWKREIENTVNGAQVTIIQSWKDLLTFNKKQPRTGSEWWVIGRDKSKLGWGSDTVSWVRSGRHYCPDCGQMIEVGQEKCDTIIKFHDRVKGCNAKLVCANRQFNRVAPAWFIKRRLKKFFDYLVIDEVHEERSIDSLQGLAAGQLAAACGKVITLTGTLVGGLAEHVRPMLFRISPGSLVRAGHTWSGKTNFNNEYGRYEVTEHENGKSTRKLVPGIMPALFGSHLIGKTIFLSLNEVAADLPPKTETEVPCEMDEQVAVSYLDCEEKIRESMGVLMRRKGMGGLGQALSFLMSYPDFPFGWKPITYEQDGEEITICSPESFDESISLPKEEQLTDMVDIQIKRGRKCWVYVQNTKTHNLLDRLVKVLREAGFNALPLKASVKPEDREEWIAKYGPSVDVIVSHPTLVQTGLDFFDTTGDKYNFPTLIFYQLGYDSFQTRQAAGRAWRIGQRLPCEVHYLHAKGTMQSRNLEIMARKVAASLSLEGEFSSEGLIAMVGTGQDSAEVMLAKSLMAGCPVDLSRVWSKISNTKFARDFFDAW